MRLTRLKFVELCSEAITATRKKITPANQLSGYLKFHKESKNYYVEDILRPSKWEIEPENHVGIHDLIEHTGIGYCHEFAQHLMVELGSRIEEAGGVAKISLVESMKCDHTYLEIRIYLDKEKTLSMWEIDAWDPRIIDISKRPNGTVKNSAALAYGYRVQLRSSFFSDKVDYNKTFIFTDIPPAKEGPPEGSCTPQHQVLDKHADIYSDYSMEKAIIDEKIPPKGKLLYLQQPSLWQKAPVEPQKPIPLPPKKRRLT